MKGCHRCKIRDELDSLKSHQEAERKDLKLCYVRGGILDDTDETTVITIDASVSRSQRTRMMDLLLEIETTQ